MSFWCSLEAVSMASGHFRTSSLISSHSVPQVVLDYPTLHCRLSQFYVVS